MARTPGAGSRPRFSPEERERYEMLVKAGRLDEADAYMQQLLRLCLVRIMDSPTSANGVKAMDVWLKHHHIRGGQQAKSRALALLERRKAAGS